MSDDASGFLGMQWLCRAPKHSSPLFRGDLGAVCHSEAAQEGGCCSWLCSHSSVEDAWIQPGFPWSGSHLAPHPSGFSHPVKGEGKQS